MKHHFADVLDRSGGHWSFVPNIKRYARRISDVKDGDPKISVVTLGKDDKNWRHALTLPKLVELTLHEPTAEQMAAVGTLRSLKRLRITHARPKDIEFLGAMTALEEVMLEYVSGFNDLSPLSTLPRLRALHLENLRRAADFSGLAGAKNLKYLSIYGTLDWDQPIEGFDFLRGLSKLEHFALSFVKCRAPFPALLPLVRLRRLKKIRIAGMYFATEEYALLEEGLGKVEGARWGAFRKFNDCFDFTGRGAGRVKCKSANADEKCREKTALYGAMKKQAGKIIGRSR